MILVPNREEVMIGQRVTFNGPSVVARALGMDIEGS